MTIKRVTKVKQEGSLSRSEETLPSGTSLPCNIGTVIVVDSDTIRLRFEDGWMITLAKERINFVQDQSNSNEQDHFFGIPPNLSFEQSLMLANKIHGVYTGIKYEIDTKLVWEPTLPPQARK